MAISLYVDGSATTPEIGAIMADRNKPNVPRVEEQWENLKSTLSVYAYGYTPNRLYPGWAWRAATDEEISASRGKAMPEPAPTPAPQPTPATITPPVVAPPPTTLATPVVPTNDWKTIAALAESSGQMTPEAREAAQRLIAGGVVNPPKPDAIGVKSGWDAAVAAAGRKFDDNPLSSDEIYKRRAAASKSEGPWDDAIANLQRRM